MKRIALFVAHYRALRRRLDRRVSLGLAWDLAVADVPPVIVYDVDRPHDGVLTSLGK